MRPIYPTTAGRPQSNDNNHQPQQYQLLGYPQQFVSQQPQPMTPAAIAALAMSSFSRSNASYMPQFGTAPVTNAYGYGISSTYVPSRDEPAQPAFRAPQQPSRPPPQNWQARPWRPPLEQPQSIDPVGKRKREEEPPVPIPGTGILLNTPEAIAAWIAERKARWPSAKRIEEKVAAKQEAQERGEINTDKSRKRLRGTPFGNVDRVDQQNGGRERHFARGQGRGRGQYRGRGVRHPPGSERLHARGHPVNAAQVSKTKRSDYIGSNRSPVAYSDPESESDDSGSDIDPVADGISFKAPVTETREPDDRQRLTEAVPRKGLQPTRILRPRTAGTQRSQTNSRDLMRALLSTEIRATVSRLSQAIRFLVDNDFLAGVEEQIGEAEGTMPIVILDPEEAAA